MPKKWPSLRAVLEFSSGTEGFTWRCNAARGQWGVAGTLRLPRSGCAVRHSTPSPLSCST